MYKKCGKFMILGVVLVLVGSITLGTAYFQGYNFDNLNNIYHSANYDTSEFTTFIYDEPLDDISNNTSNFYTEIPDTEFSEIDINISFGTINIVNGFDFKIEGHDIDRGSFNYSFENGRIYIDYSKSLGNWDFPSYNGQISITLPDNVYNNVKLHISGGEVNINNLESKNIDVELTAGTASFSSVSASDSSIIKMTAGNINYNYSNLKNLTLKMTAGSCYFNSCEMDTNLYKVTAGSLYLERCVISGVSAIDMTAGDIQMNLAGSYEDYNITKKRTAGDIYISPASSENNENAANSIDIKVTAGNCSINFYEYE